MKISEMTKGGIYRLMDNELKNIDEFREDAEALAAVKEAADEILDDATGIVILADTAKEDLQNQNTALIHRDLTELYKIAAENAAKQIHFMAIIRKGIISSELIREIDRGIIDPDRQKGEGNE